MPEYIHNDRQALLLDEYRLLLLGDPAAPAPAELDPDLAAVARTLEQRLGGPRPDPAVAPRPAFTAALRQQLQQQAAERATTVAPGTLAPTTALNGRPAAAPRQSVRRAWRHGQPAPAPAPRAGQAGPSGATGEPLADRLPAPVSSRRQAVWATTRTFAGWVSAAALDPRHRLTDGAAAARHAHQPRHAPDRHARADQHPHADQPARCAASPGPARHTGASSG
jgi:hypothetical protein